jgi:hypothetical protein
MVRGRLMPVVVVTAVRLRTPSSQLLLPLAFAAYAGSLLALTGTPINVIVSKAAAYAGIANSASSSSRSSACPWWPESSRSHCCSVPAAAVAQPTGDAARLHRGRRSVPHPGGDRREPMVLSPGGYRFGDYWKLGLLMLAWFLLVAVRGSADLEVLMATGAPDDPDTLPVLPSGSIPAAPERPATAQPGVLRRLVRPPFSYAGATVALLFFWLSLTPSLLPRAPLFSGAVGGVTAMTGYGVGAALGALSHRLLRWRPPVAGRRTWLVLAVVAVVGTPLVLWQAARWQDGLRALIGLEPESATGPVTIVLVAAVVSGVILLVVRLIGVFGGWTTRQVGRFLPPRLAAALGAVLTVVVLVGFAQGFLWRGFVAAMDRVASVADAGTDEGASRPRADPLRSGSDASLVAWESLGRMGRRFVGFGPTLADLRRFDPPGCCKTPVRVYVGLDDGDSAQERAAIAVRELDRTGGFRRKVLAIYTVTGTGWVNPRAADGLEYLYGGDTAQVSIAPAELAVVPRRPDPRRRGRPGPDRRGPAATGADPARAAAPAAAVRREPGLVRQRGGVPGPGRAAVRDGRRAARRSDLLQPDVAAPNRHPHAGLTRVAAGHRGARRAVRPRSGRPRGDAGSAARPPRLPPELLRPHHLVEPEPGAATPGLDPPAAAAGPGSRLPVVAAGHLLADRGRPRRLARRTDGLRTQLWVERGRRLGGPAPADRMDRRRHRAPQDARLREPVRRRTPD